jgi:serine/threonine protein kinase
MLRGTSGVYRLEGALHKWEDYKVAEKALAAGAFGEVYVATVVTPVAGLKVNDKVAIKKLKAASPLFATELAAYTALSQACPNAVPVLYESGMTDGKPFVVTELLDGSIAAVCDEKKPNAAADLWWKTAAATPQTVEAVWKQMVQAVSCLHQHGVVHADIKPGV